MGHRNNHPSSVALRQRSILVSLVGSLYQLITMQEATGLSITWERRRRPHMRVTLSRHGPRLLQLSRKCNFAALPFYIPSLLPFLFVSRTLPTITPFLFLFTLYLRGRQFGDRCCMHGMDVYSDGILLLEKLPQAVSFMFC